MTRDEAEQLIRSAIGLLFERDADLPRDANERSATHRLAVHMETLLREQGRTESVDCEYNRMGTRPKRLHTLVEVFARGATIQDLVADTTGRTVFPDIVVHRRGLDGPNLLVVEAKRLGAALGEVNRDRDKLRAYVDELDYANAYLLLLGDDADSCVIERIETEQTRIRDES